MAADLHIHVFEGCTEEDLAHFFANSVGSKWFAGFGVGSDRQNCYKNNCESTGPCNRVTSTPSIWIGEVSWLKAALFDDPETFVPGPVAQIADLIREDLPVLTEELKEKILSALKTENKTGYSISEEAPVKEFLEKQIGKKLFTISW